MTSWFNARLKVSDFIDYTKDRDARHANRNTSDKPLIPTIVTTTTSTPLPAPTQLVTAKTIESKSKSVDTKSDAKSVDAKSVDTKSLIKSIDAKSVPAKIQPVAISKSLNLTLSHTDFQRQIMSLFAQFQWQPPQDLDTSSCGKESAATSGKSRILDMDKTQQFVSTYFVPESPLKGILLWHSVGAGKTCSAVAIATSAFAWQGYDVYWITKTTLRGAMWGNHVQDICNMTLRDLIKTGKVDLKSVVDPKSNASTIRSWINSNLKVGNKGSPHNIRPTREPLSYRMMTNLVERVRAGTEHADGSMVDKYKRHGDMLHKTLIIVDEAHDLYDLTLPSANTSAAEIPRPEILEQAIWDSYAKSGADSVRILLLTATPMTKTFMTLPTLLNLCIPLKEGRFPHIKGRAGIRAPYVGLDEKDFRDTFVTANGHLSDNGQSEFREKCKGLISYVDMTTDIRRFAQKAYDDVNVVVTDVQDKAIKKCKGGSRAGQCVMEQTMWANLPMDYNIANAAKYKGLRGKYNDIRKSLPTTAPRIQALLDKIRELDARDNSQFKHAIYANVHTRYGVSAVGAALLAHGYELCLALDGNRVVYKPPTSGTDRKSFLVLSSQPYWTKSVSKDSRGLRDRILKVWNDRPGNIHGEMARFLLFDSQFKMGVNMFDVKYLHVLDILESKADEDQVLGRVARSCGQVGLQFLPKVGWEVEVFFYVSRFSEKSTTVSHFDPSAPKKEVKTTKKKANVKKIVKTTVKKTDVTADVHANDHSLHPSFSALTLDTGEPIVTPYQLAWSLRHINLLDIRVAHELTNLAQLVSVDYELTAAIRGVAGSSEQYDTLLATRDAAHVMPVAMDIDEPQYPNSAQPPLTPTKPSPTTTRYNIPTPKPGKPVSFERQAMLDEIAHLEKQLADRAERTRKQK